MQQVLLAGRQRVEQVGGLGEGHQLAQERQAHEPGREHEDEAVGADLDEDLPPALEQRQQHRGVRQQQQAAAGDRPRAHARARRLLRGDDQQRKASSQPRSSGVPVAYVPCTAPSR